MCRRTTGNEDNIERKRKDPGPPASQEHGGFLKRNKERYLGPHAVECLKECLKDIGSCRGDCMTPGSSSGQFIGGSADCGSHACVHESIAVMTAEPTDAADEQSTQTVVGSRVLQGRAASGSDYIAIETVAAAQVCSFVGGCVKLASEENVGQGGRLCKVVPETCGRVCMRTPHEPPD
jgi:hypothetical protein